MAIKKRATKRRRLKDPKGGLTAAGRRWFARKEGAHLKPGVRGAADTPEKLRRKGSFLRRHFAHPRGPMVNAKGEPTRLALSAHAWGEPVPKTMAAAKKLAEKGARLLERYEKTKEKSMATKKKTGAKKAVKRATPAKTGARKATKRTAAKKAATKKAAKKKTTAKKSTAKKAANKKSPAKRKAPAKNSLVGNINRRKRAGKSRPKSRTTISKDSYRAMQNNWS